MGPVPIPMDHKIHNTIRAKTSKMIWRLKKDAASSLNE